jgi:hypothetical protein
MKAEMKTEGKKDGKAGSQDSDQYRRNENQSRIDVGQYGCLQREVGQDEHPWKTCLEKREAEIKTGLRDLEANLEVTDAAAETIRALQSDMGTSIYLYGATDSHSPQMDYSQCLSCTEQGTYL